MIHELLSLFNSETAALPHSSIQALFDQIKLNLVSTDEKEKARIDMHDSWNVKNELYTNYISIKYPTIYNLKATNIAHSPYTNNSKRN